MSPVDIISRGQRQFAPRVEVMNSRFYRDVIFENAPSFQHSLITAFIDTATVRKFGAIMDNYELGLLFTEQRNHRESPTDHLTDRSNDIDGNTDGASAVYKESMLSD